MSGNGKTTYPEFAAKMGWKVEPEAPIYEEEEPVWVRSPSGEKRDYKKQKRERPAVEFIGWRKGPALPVEYLIDRMIKRRGAGIIGGQPKDGKSLVAASRIFDRLRVRALPRIHLGQRAQFPIQARCKQQSERGDKDPGQRQRRNCHDGCRHPSDQRKQDHSYGKTDQQGENALVQHAPPVHPQRGRGADNAHSASDHQQR